MVIQETREEAHPIDRAGGQRDPCETKLQSVAALFLGFLNPPALQCCFKLGGVFQRLVVHIYQLASTPAAINP
jgi:hypothetical protein